MGNQRRLVCTGILAIALAVTGCAPDPESAGVEGCKDKLLYEMEQASPATVWADATLEVTDVTVEQRSEGQAWDVSGVVTATLPNGTTVSTDWTCFTQHVDGETYSAIQEFGGECSSTRRKAIPEDC